MKTDIWMPLYIGDYLADTIGLSHSQHGAYLLALMAYWRKGGPLSDEEAKSIMGEHVNSLSRFFRIEADGWHSKRADIELSLSHENSERNKARTAAATKARLQRNVNVTSDVTFTPSPSPSPSPLTLPESAPAPSPTTALESESVHNHPELGKCISHFKELSDYSATEVRAAFLEFEGDAVNGDWLTWRNRPVTDWRAAMEDRMAHNRGKNNGKSNQTNRGNTAKGFDRARGTLNEGTAKSYNIEAVQKSRALRDARRTSTGTIP